MPAYVIYEGEVRDPARYEQYKQLAAARAIREGAAHARMYVVDGVD